MLPQAYGRVRKASFLVLEIEHIIGDTRGEAQLSFLVKNIHIPHMGVLTLVKDSRHSLDGGTDRHGSQVVGSHIQPHREMFLV